MPSSYTQASPDLERKLPGTGGKPPVTRRPTGGGGGGGGDDEHKNPRRGPRELLHRVRTFVFCALAGDMMFFAVLVAMFYARQAGTRIDLQSLRLITDWHPLMMPPILFLNTALLLVSSLAMERARWQIFREIDVLEEWLGLGKPALRRTLPWVALTFTLGALFLAGQMIAWRQLTTQGFPFDHTATPASYFFYLITGMHALHLIAGLLALLFCLVGLARLGRVESRQVAVDSVAWFWHAMNLAWIVLFAVLIFGQ
jgi:cytochrome c oxidase subunit 3